MYRSTKKVDIARNKVENLHNLSHEVKILQKQQLWLEKCKISKKVVGR